jgi:hypothetical protein
MWRRAGFVGDANAVDIDRTSKPLLFPVVDGWGFTAFVDVARGRVCALGGVARFGTANDNGFFDPRLVDATASTMTCGRDVVLVALVDGSTCAFHFDDDTPRDECIETIPGRICDGVIKEVGLDDDGVVYALDAIGTVWRAPSFGVETPERAFVDAKVRTFAIGPRHGVFVTDSGNAHAFGWNLHGSCGLGDTFGDFVAKPTVIESLRRVDVRVDSAACGDAFTLLLSTDGSLYATGSNSDGQLGVHESDVPRGASTRTPTLVEPPNGIDAFVSVRCGARHASALADDGAVYLWGSDDHDQLTGWNKYGNSTDDIVFTVHPPFTRAAPSVGRRVVHHACGRAHVSIFIDDVDS